MSNYAIQIKNLGKMYRIGGSQQANQTFREAINQMALSPFKKMRDLIRGQAYGAAGLDEEIWALKDISFDVEHGEVIGIIGRNGAGKSTLLKILSRITEPTTGHADLYGRVGALLEVGTGFHSELTGRENVYLNGAILGMTRRDIDRKFDEIVDFSGIEKFIDTPVKHYSSGMGLRLGFAVAAHLEPEILVVDEVLAVGDAEFQKKCLGKMTEVAGEGRTVLFVSHNMAAVKRLCTSVGWLQQGALLKLGETQTIVNEYLRGNSSSFASGQIQIARPDFHKEAYILGVELRDGSGEIVSKFDISSSIHIQMTFKCERDFREFHATVLISTEDGTILLATTSRDYKEGSQSFDKGQYTTELIIPSYFLAEGSYYVTVSVVETALQVKDEHKHILRFDVQGSPFFRPRTIGNVIYPFEWNII